MIDELIERLSKRVGETRSYSAPEPIGAAAFRYFALAVGDDNPLYTDEQFAREQGFPSVIAPPTLICETNQYSGSSMNEFGYAGHDWGLHEEGTRLLRGGNAYEFLEPVLPTDIITATWRITEVYERTSSTGARFIVVMSEAEYCNQYREVRARNQETLIVQPLEGFA